MPHRSEINGELRLDRVVASQPELGPSIPDGGYGWVILFACMFLQIFIPSILASYGILILYNRIESSTMSDNPKLWEATLLPTPILYVAVWTVTDPWSRTIVTTSTWPRLVTITGICLTCAGLLIEWIAIRDALSIVFYIIAGLFSGFGASLILTQSETLINQYFRLKLSAVNNVLACSYALGFIIVPVLFGILIYKRGILQSLLIYQTIILQSIIMVLVFKKPLYLKAERRRYELLQNASEDDEMIFAKDEVTTGNNTNTNESAASSSNTVSNTTSEANGNVNKKSTLLTESFASEFSQDLGRNFSNDNDNTPKPLFSEAEMRNGESASYSYDNTEIHLENETFHLPPERVISSNIKQEMSFLLKFSFYKALMLTIAMKYSSLIFWTLFPTYLYVEMDVLKMRQTTFLVGAMGLGSLGVALISSFLPVIGSNKQIAAAVFSFLCSIGFFVLSDAGSEGWLLFGALEITISLTGHHILYSSLIKYILGPDCEKAHTLLQTLAGISVMMLLAHDISYKNCFRIMSLLQLITGSFLLYNFLRKCFKKLFGR